MAKCVFRDGTVIEDFGQPYIVAEVNSSHNGDVSVAKQMIDAAVECGCNCVKFQSWSAESLYSKTYYDENRIAGRFVHKFALSESEISEVCSYCMEKGIAFSSTPYSESEVDYLIDKCKVPFIKISSMELNNKPFLQYVGAKHVPVVLSTGMGTAEEIRNAVKVMKEVGVENMVLLHCVSVYPVAASMVNLNNIVGLREEYKDYPIGFSDHTEGDAIAGAAIALGAALLEKHITLDKTKVGMDNGMATDPDEMKELVEKCHRIHSALGSKLRTVSEAEYAQRLKMRRSVIAVRDIPAGTILKREDLYAKRPGTGISVTEIDELPGRKLLNDVKADTLIMENDLEAL